MRWRGGRAFFNPVHRGFPPVQPFPRRFGVSPTVRSRTTFTPLYVLPLPDSTPCPQPHFSRSRGNGRVEVPRARSLRLHPRSFPLQRPSRRQPRGNRGGPPVPVQKPSRCSSSLPLPWPASMAAARQTEHQRKMPLRRRPGNPRHGFLLSRRMSGLRSGWNRLKFRYPRRRCNPADGWAPRFPACSAFEVAVSRFSFSNIE